MFHYTRPEANELKIEHKIKTKNTNIFGVNLLFFFCLPNIFYITITYTMSVIIQDVAVIIFSLKTMRYVTINIVRNKEQFIKFSES